MKKWNWTGWLGVVVLCVTALAGCGTHKTEASVSVMEVKEVKPANATGRKFGWSVYTLDNQFFKRMDTSVEEKAEELGITLLMHDQNSDPNEMVKGCKSLISQDVEALLVSPCNPERMPEIIDLAHEKKIPVVIVDIGDGGGDKDAIIVSDCYTGGEEVGNYAVNLLRDKQITGKEMAIVKCEETAVYARRRGEGFTEAVEAAGYQIIAEETGDSREDLGYEKAKRILEGHPDVAVIFAENDMMALGVAQAVKEAGSEALVFGFDGNQLAVNAIIEGRMHGTMLQDSEAMGRKGVEIANQLADGKTLTYDDPETKEFYVNGYMMGEDSDLVDETE